MMNQSLIDTKVAEYGLIPHIWEFNVRIRVTNEEIHKIHELLLGFQNWESNGNKSFADYDISDWISVMIRTNSTNYENSNI